MDNDRVKEIFLQCYNGFWNKWKAVPLERQSPEWEEIAAESRVLAEKYQCDLCSHMIRDFLDILENRCRKREMEHEQHEAIKQ